MTTLRLILLLSFLYLTMEGSAQVFIPDQVERDWLNTEIPGIVDGNGIMDTLHPGIAQLDTTLIFIGVMTQSLFFYGVIGVGIAWAMGRWRDSRPDGYLQHMLFWYGIVPLKARCAITPFIRKFYPL